VSKSLLLQQPGTLEPEEPKKITVCILPGAIAGNRRSAAHLAAVFVVQLKKLLGFFAD
jgi:hypothetical protein